METLLKRVILILLLALGNYSYSQQKHYMDYVLSWDGISSKLKVDLTYNVSEKDSTVFIFGDPNFGGQPDIFTVIKNVRSSASEIVKIDKAERRIIVVHNGSKKHRLSYEIDGSFAIDKPTIISQTELFRP